MNELRKTISTLWTGLTAPQKISIIASLFVVVAILIAVVYFASKPNMTLLYANLPSAEASKIIDYLHNDKVPYQIADGGKSILVPSAKVYELRLKLASAGIPKAADTAGGVGFEIFDRPTFGMSDFMQKANYYRALQGELARTISQMEEIEETRVMIVVPEDRLFRTNDNKAKASVFVKLKANTNLTEEQIRAIRFFVSNGVEGLEAERVALIDNFGRALAENKETKAIFSASSDQIEMTQRIEDTLREKAQSMLDRVLGPGQAVVRISAKLNFDAVQETAERFDPQSAVVKNEASTTESSRSETASQGGVAGVVPNTGANQDLASNKPNVSEQSRETVNNEYAINRTVEMRQRASGEIERLTVAVFVNTRKIGEEPPVARTQQEIQNLEEIVKQAVGFTQNDARKDSIKVEEMEFVDMFATADKEEPKKNVMADISTYLPYISQGFLILLAISVFFYFRNLFKGSDSKGAKDGSFADLLSRIEKMEQPMPILANGKVAPLGRQKGLSVEEMSKLIRENPNNTTQAIKQWLSARS